MAEATHDANLAHYDVVIIGSGAGGGTLAWKLAPSGKRILLLERGGYLPRERDNWDSGAVFVRGKYLPAERWHDQHGNEFTPEQHYYVGGNTKFYGAALFRLRPEDFGEIHHHGGTSPAWPISYDDLEPWYAQAEALYHVHGAAGEDPTEGRRSSPYPYPPVRHEPRIQQLSDDLARLGLHPAHLPIGVRLDQEADGSASHGSTCIRCDRVDGFPCVVGGKADAQVLCVDPALAAHPNLELVTHARVKRLETDATGRQVTAVVATVGDGPEQRFSGDLVVVACGAINSAALLLRSANDHHPTGLANRSDQVGRNYLRHNSQALMALSREPNPTLFQKTLCLDDWYLGDGEGGLPLGGIQLLGKADGSQVRANAPRWSGAVAPSKSFEVMAAHGIGFWLTTEDLPHPGNRVTVDAGGSVRLAVDEKNNIEGMARLRHRLESMLDELGLEEHLWDHSVYLHKSMPIGAVAHQAGTARFGTDPATSVLDLDCKAHDLDNLYVVDSSFFVSIGAVNPTLTIIANALRVGEHLLGRL
ncbi:MAG: dehydrogenase [Acidimicrobiia bacterium]|nr:dehydrogenase [Acidimicrobiia bacterium]